MQKKGDEEIVSVAFFILGINRIYWIIKLISKQSVKKSFYNSFKD